MTKSDLTSKQRAAIRALISGASYPMAAEAARVHPNTVGQWMGDQRFLEGLRQAESEALEGVCRSLVSIASKASGALETVLDNEKALDSSKIRAADVVLNRLMQIKEIYEIEKRLTEIERQLKNDNGT